jgi:CRISPR-associated protein Cas2
MDVDARRRYLLTYDVRDPKRLRAVHRTAKTYGWSMQYSVFICDLDKVELMALRVELGEVIDHSRDSIGLIDLGSPNERGRSSFSFMGVHPELPMSGPVIL